MAPERIKVRLLDGIMESDAIRRVDLFIPTIILRPNNYSECSVNIGKSTGTGHLHPMIHLITSRKDLLFNEQNLVLGGPKGTGMNYIRRFDVKSRHMAQAYMRIYNKYGTLCLSVEEKQMPS